MGKLGYRLLNQTNGRVKSFALPEAEAWSLLSVSPWRDKDGNLEAAGRWVTRGEGNGEFCGIGCLTLPSIDREKSYHARCASHRQALLAADTAGRNLFPAGDGQLYRCNITGQGGDKRSDDRGRFAGKNEGKVVKARADYLGRRNPGAGVAIVSDPAVLPEPGFRHLVFVALGMQERPRWHSAEFADEALVAAS